MSGSSRRSGRVLQNSRAVSYDQAGNYATDSAPASSAYAPQDNGAGEAREILSGRGLY
jgi:rare lipoprotein A